MHIFLVKFCAVSQPGMALQKMARDKGFSLIELLLAVAVILVLAAISIPNLIRARIAANESSAVSSLRTIMTAESAYNTTYANIGYAAALSDLAGSPPCTPAPNNACLIDSVLATGFKAGFSFNAVGGTPSPLGANTSFYVGAAPFAPNTTGVRRFCGVNDNVIHYDLNPGLSAAVPTAANCANAPFAGQIIQ
jgi:prepilin-type N-terminal cleavage/methylation domain-containing protein